MRRNYTWTTTIVVAATVLALTSCGEDEPAVCTEANEFRAAVQELRDVNLREDGLGTLTPALEKVKTEFEQLRTEAKGDYQPQVDDIKASVDEVSSSLSAATADPSAAALSSVGTALGNLETAARSLQDATASTC